MGRLVSVNVGMPRDITWRGETVHTGIWKQPVPVSRCTEIEDYRLNVFNIYPRFPCNIIVVKSGISVLKSRRERQVKFVRDLNAKVATIKGASWSGSESGRTFEKCGNLFLRIESEISHCIFGSAQRFVFKRRRWWRTNPFHVTRLIPDLSAMRPLLSAISLQSTDVPRCNPRIQCSATPITVDCYYLDSR